MLHDVVHELILLHDHQHSDDHLRDNDDQQDARIGHGHAVRLPNGAAASEERDEEDDASQHDQDDGNEGGIMFLEGSLQVTSVDQGHDTQGDKGDASQLQKKNKKN